MLRKTPCGMSGRGLYAGSFLTQKMDPRHLNRVQDGLRWRGLQVLSKRRLPFHGVPATVSFNRP